MYEIFLLENKKTQGSSLPFAIHLTPLEISEILSYARIANFSENLMAFNHFVHSFYNIIIIRPSLRNLQRENYQTFSLKIQPWVLMTSQSFALLPVKFLKVIEASS